MILFARNRILHFLGGLTEEVAGAFGVELAVVGWLARFLAVELLQNILIQRKSKRLVRERALISDSRLAGVVVAFPLPANLLAHVLHLFQLHVKFVIGEVLMQDFLAKFLGAHDALGLWAGRAG